jgi:hypothetical protein
MGNGTVSYYIKSLQPGKCSFIRHKNVAADINSLLRSIARKLERDAWHKCGDKYFISGAFISQSLRADSNQQ